MNATNSSSRMERLRSLMIERGYDAIVLRNNPDIRWLTGAARVFDDEVAHTAIVTPNEAWLHTDGRYYGSFIDRMGATSEWCIDMEIVSHASWVAERLAGIRARVVAIEDTVTLGFYESLKRTFDAKSFSCLLPRLHGDLSVLRMVKEEDELVALNKAQQITDEAFSYICEKIQIGMTEIQVQVELESYMMSHGAEGLSFDTIVASGPNGANPHARPSTRAIRSGDLIVMDYGALYGDYHADMTRTVCVGEPSPEQRKAYDTVRRAHEECAKLARPNMTGKELHEHAVRIIEDAGFGGCFNHGLGHGVGLEIHEKPVLGRGGTDPIPVGAVFTIEPGIYVNKEYGIRLEDFGVMTSDGYLPFTESTHELVSVSL